MKKIILGVAVWLGLSVGCPNVGRADWAEDERIREKIEARFRDSDEIKKLMDERVLDKNAIQVKVEVMDGVATLSGRVRERASKRPFIQLARMVPGVKELQDKIQVIPLEKTNEDMLIKKELEEKFAQSKEIHGRYGDNFYWDTSDQVTVEVSEGFVTLRGIVKDTKSRDAYVRIARETKGVQRVEVKIQVIPMERKMD